MKLGTGLFTCQQRPDDDRSMEEIYQEMLQLGEIIDNAGLDSAWVSEHHFAKDGYLSATMPTLGALAATTESVEIGSCIALAPLYDGVRLAEDTATIDLLAEGRLTLGLAIGSNPAEYDAFGIPREQRFERLIDQVSLLRAAWSDGPLDYESEFHDIDPNVSVSPKPEGTIPIMFGGAAKPAVRRAARLADAWCAPSTISLKELQTRVEDIRSVREEEGIEAEFQIYVLAHGFVGESRDRAWEHMRKGYYYIQQRYAEIFSEGSVPLLDADRKRELQKQAIFGTPEQVADELLAYRRVLGDDIHFILRTYYPGIGTEVMASCLNQLADNVRPLVS